MDQAVQQGDRGAVTQHLGASGFAFVQADDFDRLLPAYVLTPESWDAFAASWDNMPLDQYMADGGRYRRRRFAVFTAEPGQAIERAAHQPHYQSRDYNNLNGGVARWFAPMADVVGKGACFQALLTLTRALFEAVAGAQNWHIEAHQFRIETGPDGTGMPTPEGMHRDGVDYVLVLMVRRANIEQGTTTIHDLEQRNLGEFTLVRARDAALVDDRLVFHGVTPVVPVDPLLPAFRDVLVLTYRRV